MKIELKITGRLPKYFKVFTNSNFKVCGYPIYTSKDRREYKKSKTTIKDSLELSLYEQLYRHIEGNDYERWMLFQLKKTL